MRRVFFIIALFLSATLAFAQQDDVETEPYIAEHPLDALTAEEIAAATEMVRTAGLAGAQALFPTITLEEPPKDFARSWSEGQPFPRKALVVARDEGRTVEAHVDLLGGKVTDSRIIPGAQPMIMDAEWLRAREAFENDPRFEAALRKRGLAASEDIFCTPNSAGTFPGENAEGRRILKVPCFSAKDKLHPSLARPIEGLMGVVDSETGDVLAVLDRQHVPLPPAPPGYGDSAPPPDPPIKPQELAAPQGSNIEVKGNLSVNWLRWSFHLRADKRAGLIVSRVQFRDGGRERDMAYQMNVSEMFVPYMDPDETWAYRTFMDVGEFGLGYLMSVLEPGVDCPENALYADLTFPNDSGGSYVRERALCLFERNTGDPGWRHYSSGSAETTGEPRIEFVVRHIPTLGNYDYVIDYVFSPHGDIRLRVGATGFDAIKSVAAKDMETMGAAEETRFGNLIAPYTVAPFHDHYVNFRLDLDVDGTENALVRDIFTPQAVTGPRRSLWTVRQERISAEGPVTRGHGAGSEIFRLENPLARNGLKQAPSLWLNSYHDAQSILDPADPPQQRAQFSANTFWVTRYKPDELWAAGPFPNLSVGDDGLPRFVGDQQNVAGQDIVMWYTMGFRHLTRPEDFPILPTFWHEMTIRPAFFFDRDPGMTFNSGRSRTAE